MLMRQPPFDEETTCIDVPRMHDVRMHPAWVTTELDRAEPTKLPPTEAGGLAQQEVQST